MRNSKRSKGKTYHFIKIFYSLLQAFNDKPYYLSTADNGTVHMWDWRTGYNFQRTKAPVQPGSLDSESGVFAMAFDKSESRLITCEADKTIKIYKEDDEAVSPVFGVITVFDDGLLRDNFPQCFCSGVHLKYTRSYCAV